MAVNYRLPGHRELTEAEEMKILHMEEQIEKAEKKSPVLMKGYLETLNDGVIAIIITIMVMNLPVPEGKAEFFLFLKSIGFFLISFFVVADFWYEHRRIFEMVRGAGHGIVVLNFVFLAFLSLVPVATKWILSERTSWSVVSYGILYLACRVTQILLQAASLRDRFRGFERLFFDMFAMSAGIVLAANVILIVLGWYYPKAIMPCYLLIPVISFIMPKRRKIIRQEEILRSTAERAPDNHRNDTSESQN